MNISPSGLPVGSYTHATNVTDSEHLKSAATTHYAHNDAERLASDPAMRVAARGSSCYGRFCWRQESRLDGLPAVIGCPAA
jgi:hypothetical protein